VTLTASGGVTYTWNVGGYTVPTITVAPTAPTSYSVGVTNSVGCTTGNIQVVVTVPQPTLNLTTNFNTICLGDQVNISVSGASTYTWSTGSNATSITDNPPQTTVYTVTGTALGCNNTQTINIGVFAPTVAITGPTAVCSGASATLTAGAADTYSWSNGFTFPSITDAPTSTTVYTLTALSTSSGVTCPSTSTFQVLVNPNPSVNIVASSTAICRGEQVSLTANGAGTYSWSDGSTSTSISITPTVITTLIYSVTGISAQNCSNTAVTLVRVNSCNGIGEINATLSGLSIYPNPSTGNFTVRYGSALELVIVNEPGQLVKKISLNSSNGYAATVSGLAKGIYFLMGQKNEATVNRKIVVE
jgi:hypothetical protein